MKERILTNWNLIRVIRLLLGAGIAAQGILQAELFFTIAGAFILLGAELNYGCGGSGGCSVSYSPKADSKTGPEKVDTAKQPR